MVGRQPLPLGAHGNIPPPRQLKSGLFEARCRVRDADGETREVRRRGKSKSAALNNLRKALAERALVVAGAQLTSESSLADAAGNWFDQRQSELDAGELADDTLRVYRSAWTVHIEPPLGKLRLREITVARCEAWLQALRRNRSNSVASTSRTVLSGILGLAARMGAIQTNPTRDLSRIPSKPKRRPRALTRAERTRWLSHMQANPKAARWDIPDLTVFMLAVGCRVGEALAVTWDEIDFDASTVTIRWKLIRVKGQGLQQRPGTKRGAEGGRVLRVPSWCIAMLMRRRTDPASGWPVFPDSLGGWRDPSNTLRVLRESRDAAGFDWVTSHVFRKTCATAMDEAGMTAREIADVLEHADPALTQRVYLGRGIASDAQAEALEDLL